MRELSGAAERYRKSGGKRGRLIAGMTLCVLAGQASALPAGLRSAGQAYLQDSAAGAPQGKPFVAAEVMDGHCITRVSPLYPQTGETPRNRATVVVRVVISRSGGVSPVRFVSGDNALEAEAMNAVRLWRYKPFVRNGEVMDVTTDVSVVFDPQIQGGMISHPKH
jgi:periplasmic protein TonB